MSSLENKIALSTCCCSHRFEDGYALLEWIASLGFNYAELSHGISISLVPGIVKAVDDGVIKISSIHNFCPLPIGINAPVPNLFKPSSSSRAEVSLWTRHTLETFNFAQSLGVDKVVMHSGSAWFFFESPLKNIHVWLDQSDLKMEDLASDEGFIKLRDRALKRIRKASKKHKDILIQNYKSIFESAKQSNVYLGIENREGFIELPLDDDHEDFIKEFTLESPMRYWHDTGHAEIKAQYGLLNHSKRLEDLKDYLIGFHLHDVNESGKDHQEIGTGIIDFQMIKEFLDAEKQAIVLELSPALSEKSILKSKDAILNFF